MSDTRSVIEASIASARQDSPADGGPEPTETADAPESGGSGDPDPEPETDLADPDPVDADPDEPAKVAEPEPVKEPVEKKPEDDDFDKEPEYTEDKNGRKQVNRIPQPRVKKMVEHAVAKAVEAERAAHTEKIGGFEKQLKSYDQLGEIMESDPDRFMQMLTSTHPAYKQYVKGGAAPVPEKSPAADDPMPAPDARLPDGTPAYSPEGFKAVQDWNARQVEARVLGKVNEQFKWVNDAKAAEDRRAAEAPKIRQQIGHALSNWEGFKENFNDILSELRTDSEQAAREGREPQLTLHDAYRVVTNRTNKAEREKLAKEVETLKTDRNKMREDILKELQGRSTSTAALPTTPVVARDTDPVTDPKASTRDVIAASVARMRRK